VIKKIYGYLNSVGIFVAATIGAGIFALPKTFELGGWALGTLYLVSLSGILIYAHYIYWLALEKRGNPSLLGLVNSELGGWAKQIGFVSIILGLLLTLAAYLVLGGEFLQRILSFPMYAVVLGFWAVCSLPILFNFSRFVLLEVLGSVFMVAVIIYLFVVSPEGGKFFSMDAVNFKNMFLPFGPFIAALAGWTAIEPMIKESGKSKVLKRPLKVLVYGAFVVVVLYFIFSVAISGSSSIVSSDSISGIDLLPVSAVLLLSFLGLFAVWTSYLPIVLEIKKALHRDLKFGEAVSFMVPILLPILGVWAGLNNFFGIISFVGGVFLSIEYVLIIFASEKALGLSGWKSLLAGVCGVVFGLIAVYEITYFLF
jgi:amino acid permease